MITIIIILIILTRNFEKFLNHDGKVKQFSYVPDINYTSGIKIRLIYIICFNQEKLF